LVHFPTLRVSKGHGNSHRLSPDNPARWLNKPGFKLQALSISRSFLWWTKAALDSLLCLTITMWWWRPAPGVEDGTVLPEPRLVSLVIGMTFLLCVIRRCRTSPTALLHLWR
jgi:hypothetical protein